MVLSNCSARLEDSVMWLEKSSFGFLLPPNKLIYYSVTGVIKDVLDRAYISTQSKTWTELFEEVLGRKINAAEAEPIEELLTMMAALKLIDFGRMTFKGSDTKEILDFGIFGQFKIITPDLELSQEFEVYAYKAGGTAGFDCLGSRDDDCT